MAEDNMSNIINNFKSMLKNSNISNDVDSNGSNSSGSNSSANTNSSNGNLNITPDMINNLASMLQVNFSQNGSNENTSSNQCNSSNESIGSNHSCSSESTANCSNRSDDSNSSPFGNIDFETILKFKSIMDTLNKNDDPRSNLLYSLKPYLRENRQKKIDQYANLFKITQVTSLFKNQKGDEN